jgi:CubicO group peptidase (beta-lactamase class C family)
MRVATGVVAKARPPIAGEVAPGFEAVRRAFEENFVRRGELGAACAVYHRGAKVVDLWGGYCDRGRRRPWREDTLVLVFSVTKGLAAMAMAVANARGMIDYEAPVAAYWPEFAQNGKAAITVRQLLGHEAGLCAIDERLTPATMADPRRLAAVLAHQAPAWQPGTRRGYHYLTIGWCQDELIHRVDPQRRGLGRFFHEEVARPLGIEFHIGLPPDVPASRVADIRAFHALQMLLHPTTMPRGMVLALFRPSSLTARTLGNPRLASPGALDRPEYRVLELPAASGIGQVCGIAKAYGVFATGGRELGISPRTMAALTAPARVPPGGAEDLIWHTDLAFSLGFIKPSPAFRFGSGDAAFGSEGAGGSFAFADPDAEVGFAYAPNRMGFHLFDDPREKALRDALDRCLGRPPGSQGCPA